MYPIRAVSRPLWSRVCKRSTQRNGLGIYPRQARSGAPSVAVHVGAEAFHQRNLLSDAYASNSMSDDIRRDQRPIEEKRHQLSRGQLDPMSLEPLRIFWELKMETNTCCIAKYISHKIFGYSAPDEPTELLSEVKRRLMEAGPAKETSSPTWIWRCARWTAGSLDSASLKRHRCYPIMFAALQ